MNKKTPFDFINSITFSKQDLMLTTADEKEYNSFIVNRGLSLFPDTVLFANEMNKNTGLDKRLQYDFLRTSIRKQKRWSKWPKKANIKDLDIIKTWYGYSDQKAMAALKVLTNEQINIIKENLNQGGKAKN